MAQPSLFSCSANPSQSVTEFPSSHGPNQPPKNIKRLRPKTYSVAVYLVIGIVILQVVMLISVFWLRAMVVSVNVTVPSAGKNATLYAPPDTLPKKPKPEFPNLPSIVPKVGQHALLTVPGVTDELSQIDTLNEQAQVFLHQNDYQSALDLLIRAEDLDPRHPTTLKNLAETYNLINNPIRSAIYWQRVVDLGPAVGTIYAKAKDHVLLLQSGSSADPLKEGSTLPRQIYVQAVEKSPAETKNGNAQFHVRAELKRKDPKMANFEQKKLQPYVIFYQQMPDGSLTPDLGQRKGSFDDTFLFWGDKQVEAFGVDYIMPVAGTPGPDKKPQGKYYGFVIGLYYDKVLQDVRSEPTDLSAKMPLPQEIE